MGARKMNFELYIVVVDVVVGVVVDMELADIVLVEFDDFVELNYILDLDNLIDGQLYFPFLNLFLVRKVLNQEFDLNEVVIN